MTYGITSAPDTDPSGLWTDDAGPILFPNYDEAAEAASLSRRLCRVVRVKVEIEELGEQA